MKSNIGNNNIINYVISIYIFTLYITETHTYNNSTILWGIYRND